MLQIVPNLPSSKESKDSRLFHAVVRVGVDKYKNGACVVGERLFTQTWYVCKPCVSDDKKKRFVKRADDDSSAHCVRDDDCGISAVLHRDIYNVTLSSGELFAAYSRATKDDEAVIPACPMSRRMMPCQLPCLVPKGSLVAATAAEFATKRDAFDRSGDEEYLTAGVGVLNVHLEVGFVTAFVHSRTTTIPASYHP